jgi:hypothetical protein
VEADGKEKTTNGNLSADVSSSEIEDELGKFGNGLDGIVDGSGKVNDDLDHGEVEKLDGLPDDVEDVPVQIALEEASDEANDDALDVKNAMDAKDLKNDDKRKIPGENVENADDASVEKLDELTDTRKKQSTTVTDGTFTLIGKCLFFTERRKGELRLCIRNPLSKISFNKITTLSAILEYAKIMSLSLVDTIYVASLLESSNLSTNVFLVRPPNQAMN